MDGKPVLQEARASRTRPIFYVTAVEVKDVGPFLADIAKTYQAPFFALDKLGVVICDRWYQLPVRSGELTSGVVERHTSPCGRADATSEAEAKALLLGHVDTLARTAR